MDTKIHTYTRSQGKEKLEVKHDELNGRKKKYFFREKLRRNQRRFQQKMINKEKETCYMRSREVIEIKVGLDTVMLVTGVRCSFIF